jgi:hypothetical protein
LLGFGRDRIGWLSNDGAFGRRRVVELGKKRRGRGRRRFERRGRLDDGCFGRRRRRRKSGRVRSLSIYDSGRSLSSSACDE